MLSPGIGWLSFRAPTTIKVLLQALLLQDSQWGYYPWAVVPAYRVAAGLGSNVWPINVSIDTTSFLALVGPSVRITEKCGENK